jgi:hypothetical protein
VTQVNASLLSLANTQTNLAVVAQSN